MFAWPGSASLCPWVKLRSEPLWSGALFLSGTLACSLVLSVQAFYSASDDVVQLTPSNFNKEVIQSDSLWLVEFYAPW